MGAGLLSRTQAVLVAQACRRDHDQSPTRTSHTPQIKTATDTGESRGAGRPAQRFVSAWTEQLVAGPTLALFTTKRLLNKSFEMPMDQALEHERVARVHGEENPNFPGQVTSKVLRGLSVNRC